MGLKSRRSNHPHGRYSTVLVLPAGIEKGKESTLAANRLILLDPRGEISEDELLEFLENFIEPRFWSWYLKKKDSRQKAPKKGQKDKPIDLATSSPLEGGLSH